MVPPASPPHAPGAAAAPRTAAPPGELWAAWFCWFSTSALYSPEGAEIRVTAAARGAWAVLTVENTGARIPAEALPHLFEAFYRAEPSRSRATGGSGLGLYLVRMIVERHGGTCRIENSADGVRFTALLPRLSTENT